MDTATKCLLSQQQSTCIGFKEGMFVRFYQQSLFAWNLIAERPLKVVGHQIKKMNGEWVLSGGLPVKSFLQRYPDVKSINNTYSLSVEWGATEYEAWKEKSISHITIQKLEEGARNDVIKYGNEIRLPLRVIDDIEKWDILNVTGKDTVLIFQKIKQAIQLSSAGL